MGVRGWVQHVAENVVESAPAYTPPLIESVSRTPSAPSPTPSPTSPTGTTSTTQATPMTSPLPPDLRPPGATSPTSDTTRSFELTAPTMTKTADATPSLKPASGVPEFKPAAADTNPFQITGSTAGDTSKFQPAQSGLSLMDAQTTWNPTMGSVTDDETVAAQLTRLLDANSAYVDQARQRAIQMANQRGLANSTLAAQSGEEAAISQALPIAQQDASTFLNQAQRNQQFSNAAGSQNAQIGFSKQQLGEQARQFDNDADLKTRSLLEQARQFDTGVRFEDKKLGETQRQFDNTQQLENRRLAEQQRQFDNDQLSKLSMFNRETASREQIASLDAATKAYLAKVEAQYKNELQSSASAAEMYKQYTDAVQRVLNNKDLDAANKQSALDWLARDLETGMQIIGHVANLNLGGLLVFNDGRAPLPATNTPDAGGGTGGGGSFGSGSSSDPLRNPNQSPGQNFQWDPYRGMWIETYGGGGGA